MSLDSASPSHTHLCSLLQLRIPFLTTDLYCDLRYLSSQAKRQQRKLNFLITQTELYAHFIGPKSASRRREAILGHLDEASADARIASIDDYDR